MDIFNELLLVGAAQGILLSVVILSLPAANVPARGLLALFVGLESLHLFFLYLAYVASLSWWAPELKIVFGLRVLDAPALYLYVQALTKDPFRFERAQLRHLLVLVPTTLFLIALSRHTDWDNASTQTLQQHNITVLWSLYHSVAFAGYGLSALYLLNRHLRRMEQALSSLESVDLRWLRNLLIAVVTADLMHIGYDGLRLLHIVDAYPKIVFNCATTIAMIYWLSIGGLRQPGIFTKPVREALQSIDGNDQGYEQGGEQTEAQHAGADRFAKSGLDDARIDAIWLQLQTLMSEQQPHLDPLLDLPKLARQLDLRPQELSLVINTRSGGSFYDLINRHRVDAAKQLLLDAGGQRRKMLDIALSVGFSSVSTFYSQFKKFTDTTPADFRKRAAEAVAQPANPLLLPHTQR